jgi:hypothetical protein
VVVIYAIFKNYGTARGSTQHPGGSLFNYFFNRKNFLLGKLKAAEPAELSFSFNFLGTLK